MYNSLILPILDLYCDVVWASYNKTDIERLVRIIAKAALENYS